MSTNTTQMVTLHGDVSTPFLRHEDKSDSISESFIKMHWWQKKPKHPHHARRASRDAPMTILTWRRKTWIVFNGHTPSSQLFQRCLVGLIVFNMILFVLGTESSLFIPARALFDSLEMISVILFTIEYIMRVWIAPESSNSRFSDPIWGRIRYVCTFMALVDFVSIFPFYLRLMAPVTVGSHTAAIRIVRVFRILKTEQYSHAFDSVLRVIRKNSEILFVGLAVSIVLLLITSTWLYYVGKDADHARFGSVPRCMYLAILMLAGQGIPDGVLGATTKVAVAVTALFSVAIFAIPAAMLAWGFEAEAERLAQRKKRIKRKRMKCKKLGVPYVPDPDTESDSESNSDDDEKDEGKGEDEAKGHKKNDSRSATCPACHGLGYVVERSS